MATFAELQTQWTEAKAQYHKLMLGQSVEHVWRDGRRVIYTKADAELLRSYIADLERQMSEADSSAAAALGLASYQGFAVGVRF